MHKEETYCDRLKSSIFVSSNVEEQGNSINDLLGEEKKLATPFLESDISFVFDKVKINTRKQWLMDASPVFQAMFTSSFQEANSSEIELPGKKAGVFVRFLRLVCPGFNDELSEETVHDVLPLAHEYQTSDLLKKIDHFLWNVILKTGNSLSALELVDDIIEAENYNLPNYLMGCIEVASRKHLQKLTSCARFEDVSEDTRLKIGYKNCENNVYML